MNIKDKVVLITGASSGIGYVVAGILACKGAKLSLLARRLEPMNELAGRYKQVNTEIMTLQADVTDRNSIQKAIDKTIGRFGGLDVIINNAGIGYFGKLESMEMTEFEKVVNTNIYGLLNVTQLAIPHLKKTKGMIVNISSGLSKRALPFLSAYGGTKSLVDSLSDGLRMELRKYGVKVLNYCPPETDTEFSRNALRDAKGMNDGGGRKMAKTQDVSARIVRAIECEKREVVEGKFLKIMNFFAPKFLDSLFYKVMVERLDK
jgi:short-subunit dehydrogenase